MHPVNICEENNGAFGPPCFLPIIMEDSSSPFLWGSVTVRHNVKLLNAIPKQVNLIIFDQ